MKNVTELRNDLLEVYENTKDGSIDLNVSRTLADLAGKIIKSAVVEVAYNNFIGDHRKKIPFLDGDNDHKAIK